MAAYVVERLDEVTLSNVTLLDDMDLMSPFVWKEGDRYRIMVRGVPRSTTPPNLTGVVSGGMGEDGVTFTMDAKLAITPGKDGPDAGGCEDPTVVRTADGYLVYYTGVDAAHAQGSMILASGPDLTSLTKQTLVLKAPPGGGNIKEATLAQAASGDWLLFYEYAANDASRIGCARGPSPEGPWTVQDDPFGIRQDSWDNWHLSTGPMFSSPGGDPVMFYNGATHDARWRIGWVNFDADFKRVTGRAIEPMIVPPPARDRAATDIAFAASTVAEGDEIALYYSLEDRILRRAMIRMFV